MLPIWDLRLITFTFSTPILFYVPWKKYSAHFLYLLEACDKDNQCYCYRYFIIIIITIITVIIVIIIIIIIMFIIFSIIIVFLLLSLSVSLSSSPSLLLLSLSSSLSVSLSSSLSSLLFSSSSSPSPLCNIEHRSGSQRLFATTCNKTVWWCEICLYFHFLVWCISDAGHFDT